MSDEGWVLLVGSHKKHYIVGAKSLCRKWIYRGHFFAVVDDDSPGNCAMCKRKLKKRKEKEE